MNELQTSAQLDPPNTKVSLLAKMAAKYSIDPARMLGTLKATAFKGDVSNEQMVALLVVADQYGLNPWLRELYAFPDRNNGIVPVVGIDGWSRIVNQHPQLDGIEFAEGPPNKDGLPEWIECTIFRKDRSHATKVREYMAECKRETAPWKSHPRRLLRWKSMIQCSRVAFAFTGIFDEDEAERIVEKDITPATPQFTVRPKVAPAPEPANDVIDVPDVVVHHQPQSEPQPELPVTGEPQPADEPAPQATEPAPVEVKLATAPQIAFLKKKAAAIQVGLDAIAEEVGITSLDGLTLDGFNSIKEKISELEKRQ